MDPNTFFVGLFKQRNTAAAAFLTDTKASGELFRSFVIVRFSDLFGWQCILRIEQQRVISRTKQLDKYVAEARDFFLLAGVQIKTDQQRVSFHNRNTPVILNNVFHSGQAEVKRAFRGDGLADNNAGVVGNIVLSKHGNLFFRCAVGFSAEKVNLVGVVFDQSVEVDVTVAVEQNGACRSYRLAFFEVIAGVGTASLVAKDHSDPIGYVCESQQAVAC